MVTRELGFDACVSIVDDAGINEWIDLPCYN